MDKKIKNCIMLKAISKAFNSSMSFDEFKVQLDLLGINISEAEDAYSKANSEILKHKQKWCTSNKIDFSKIFNELDYMSIVLPCGIEKNIGLLNTYTIKAIDPNEQIIAVSCKYDSLDDLAAMHGLDLEGELISTMLYEISVKFHIFRMKGIGHGTI